MHRRRPTRLIAATLAGALALSASPLLGGSPAGAADPLPPLANPIADGAFCDGAPTTNPFTDLGGESAATREVILCLVHTEITQGATATTYEPGGTVTRRQMALFIKRLADLLNEHETSELTDLPAYDNIPDYPDVLTEGAAFREAIGQLTQAGVVGGFPDGSFRPAAPVSRRQMAAFVNNLQEFLTGSPYSTSGDYFDDDEGDSGEANLNALASVGIFQGDGAGNVTPGGLLTRRQMANILLRDAQVLFAADLVDSPFAAANTSFAVTPTAAATLEVATEPSATDDRTYTVSGLTAGTSYTIQLFPAENVHGNDPYSFTEDGATNTADEGAVDADITTVNGLAQPAADDDAVVQPASGQITFVVDGVASEAVRPVIYVDADIDGNLDLDADNTPVATEPFGVGGETVFVPAEAASGAPVNGEVTRVSGTTLAVLDDSTTVYFNAGDTYRIQDGFFETAIAPVFFQNLSIGDTLSTCQTNLGLPDAYTQDAANEWCLIDSEPAEPTELSGTPAATTVELEWTASSNDSVSAYRIYLNDEACADTVPGELSLRASVSAPTVTYTATGLTPETDHCFVVTARSGTDESPLTIDSPDLPGDNTAEATTTDPDEAPSVDRAALFTDAVPTGVTTVGDVWTIEYSEPMGSPAGATFDLTDADGDTIRVACGVAVATDGLTSATCSQDDGGSNTTADDTVVITLQEAGEDRNAGSGGGGNDAIEYPLTISDSTVLVDADDDLEPTYANADTIGEPGEWD
jgi:hypothetical protein